MCRLPTQLISGRGKLRSSSTRVDSSRGESTWRWYRRRRWCAAPGADPQSSCRSVCLGLFPPLSLCLSSFLYSIQHACCCRGNCSCPLLLSPWQLQTSSCIVYCVRRELAFSQIVDDVRRQSLHQSWPVVQHLLLLAALLCDSPSFIFGCVVYVVSWGSQERKRANNFSRTRVPSAS